MCVLYYVVCVFGFAFVGWPAPSCLPLLPSPSIHFLFLQFYMKEKMRIVTASACFEQISALTERQFPVRVRFLYRKMPFLTVGLCSVPVVALTKRRQWLTAAAVCVEYSSSMLQFERGGSR